MPSTRDERVHERHARASGWWQRLRGFIAQVLKDKGLTFGVSVGLQRQINDAFVFIPELVYQASTIELEGSVGSSMLGIQLSIVRMSR